MTKTKTRPIPKFLSKPPSMTANTAEAKPVKGNPFGKKAGRKNRGKGRGPKMTQQTGGF